VALQRRVELVAQLLPAVGSWREQIHDAEQLVRNVHGLGPKQGIEPRNPLCVPEQRLDDSLQYLAVFGGHLAEPLANGRLDAFSTRIDHVSETHDRLVKLRECARDARVPASEFLHLAEQLDAGEPVVLGG